MAQDIRCTIHDGDIPCAKCLAGRTGVETMSEKHYCRQCMGTCELIGAAYQRGLSDAATPTTTPSDAAMRAAEEIAESEAHYHHENCFDKDVERVAAIITRHLPVTASQLHPYERALTIGWDTHNQRRHDLISKKRSPEGLTTDEVGELHELQWLAGIKREILSGPPPLTLSTIAAALRTPVEGEE